MLDVGSSFHSIRLWHCRPPLANRRILDHSAVTPAPLRGILLTQLLGLSEPISNRQAPLATSGKTPRFVFIDGLRGIAACSVMVFHFIASGSFYPIFQSRLPHVFAVAHFGFLGVDIFFVLSGFVIAFSVRDEKTTGRFVRRFIARRWLRLDPPYLLTIALTLLLLCFYNIGLHQHGTPIPTLGQTFANVFYLTGILKIRPMLPVFWTLCLEVQFYLLFIGALWAGRWTRDGHVNQHNWLSMSLLAMLGIASLAVVAGWLRRFDGWFINDWNLFLLGSLLWWTIARKISPGWLIAYAAALTYASLKTDNYSVYTGLLTVAAIAIAAGVGGLTTLLGNRPLQFLGKISYSLYLLHPLIGPQIDGYITWHHRDSLTLSILCVCFSVGVCIGAAWLMQRFVEMPCVRLGKRLRT
jgi:peptidoglycan/LPS O-acetylase OafA/YrhL